MDDHVFKQFHADLQRLTSQANRAFNQPSAELAAANAAHNRMDRNRVMSDEDGESPDPRFWLEFRTFSTGDSTSKEEEAFPQFARLPPELRVKIWAFSIQPRTVVSCCLHRPDEDVDGRALQARRDELERRSTRDYAVPALLHVNREARSEGLRHYELTFGWCINKMLSDTPTSGLPGTYFNYDLDCLFLTGELEAYDSYGFNSPMVYFMRQKDTNRVRHVACSFKELGYPEQESDQIFGCLWHVVDRFPRAERLLLTVEEGDEERLGWGGKRLLDENSSAADEDVNVMQKIWSGWMSGTTVTGSTMADKQMLMVREEELMGFVASQA